MLSTQGPPPTPPSEASSRQTPEVRKLPNKRQLSSTQAVVGSAELLSADAGRGGVPPAGTQHGAEPGTIAVSRRRISRRRCSGRGYPAPPYRFGFTPTR